MAKPKKVTGKVLDKLRRFDTPTICNVIELFEVRPDTAGYMDARIKASYNLPPMVGFASTALFRSAQPPRGQDAYSSIEAQVEGFAELSGPAVLVFQDLDDPPVAATFGEVMCTTYKAFGAVGLITSGAGRDIEQVGVLDFPVFTGGTICSHGYNHIPEIQVPVRLGGLMVYPNDLLHGDVNGVAAIPVEIASDVADASEEFMAAENELMATIRGDINLKALREARSAFKARIAGLRKRVRK